MLAHLALDKNHGRAAPHTALAAMVAVARGSVPDRAHGLAQALAPQQKRHHGLDLGAEPAAGFILLAGRPVQRGVGVGGGARSGSCASGVSMCRGGE